MLIKGHMVERTSVLICHNRKTSSLKMVLRLTRVPSDDARPIGAKIRQSQVENPAIPDLWSGSRVATADLKSMPPRLQYIINDDLLARMTVEAADISSTDHMARRGLTKASDLDSLLIGHATIRHARVRKLQQAPYP